jgi:DNA helicase II / ATP-dependent DNA helicase PcrA
MKLDADEMKLQIGLYAVAAKNELSYEPELGLVRYLDETDPKKAEMGIPLDSDALDSARARVAGTAIQIRNRNFFAGPTARPRDSRMKSRCSECDFPGFCGQCRKK